MCGETPPLRFIFPRHAAELRTGTSQPLSFRYTVCRLFCVVTCLLREPEQTCTSQTNNCWPFLNELRDCSLDTSLFRRFSIYCDMITTEVTVSKLQVYLEEGGNKFLRNACNYPQVYTESSHGQQLSFLVLRISAGVTRSLLVICASACPVASGPH
jgi:hypothetical protein